MSAAQAEDIDLFVGYNQTVTDAPNVLFVLDNTANWNQPFTAEINALASAFESLPDGKFKVGVMMFSETGGGNSNIDGAYLRAGVRMMDEDNKAQVRRNMIRQLSTSSTTSPMAARPAR